MKTKIFTALLTVTLLATTANSTPANDIRKQCQYLVYGNGKSDSLIDFYMMGIITGVKSMMEAKNVSDFGLNSTNRTVKYKACQRALINTMEFDFEKIYAYELIKLIRK